MAAISQMTFSNGFSWMKMFEFWLKFHRSLFLWAQLIIFQHWFRWRLRADQTTSYYLNQWWLVYWRIIYASLGLNDLKRFYSNLQLQIPWCLRHQSICSCRFDPNTVFLKNTVFGSNLQLQRIFLLGPPGTKTSKKSTYISILFFK